MEKEKLEEKIGECIGLERAAQQAVQELDSKGLLDEPEIKKKMMAMQKEASGHEQKMQGLVDKVTESEGLDAQSIEQHAHETVEKAAEMMKTYLGEKPDTLAALEFLGLAEGGEVIHYEVLSKMAAEVKDKKFATGVRAILAEEQDHLKSCIRLAKQRSVAA
jgi:hypothetical protein